MLNRILLKYLEYLGQTIQASLQKFCYGLQIKSMRSQREAQRLVNKKIRKDLMNKEAFSDHLGGISKFISWSHMGLTSQNLVTTETSALGLGSWSYA